MVRTVDTAGVDLVLELGDASADRNCLECGEAADYYVRTEGVFSGFACDQDLHAAVDRARA